MTEEQMLAAIKYVEENNGSGPLGGQDKSFVTLAKSLAQVLKAKLVKVEDGFGDEASRFFEANEKKNRENKFGVGISYVPEEFKK
jgi:hypothetical protein